MKIVPHLTHPIFSGKNSVISVQFFRYIFIGGVSAIFDTIVFFLFSSIFETHYIIAQTFGFLVGITLNYFLSVTWIFESKYGKVTETSLFFITGVIGLLLSYFFLWFLIDVLGLSAWNNLIAKILTLALTLLWNFTSRKVFVFKR